jgi:hypothetical protein
VSVANCTYGVQPIPEQHAYITIGQSRTLTFAVTVIYEVSQAYQCTGIQTYPAR